MIIYMSNILCVTNKNICNDDFFSRIEDIAKCNINGIILREKDLSYSEYKNLAIKVMDICNRHNTKLILHSFVDIAIELNIDAIHVPFDVLKKMNCDERAYFKVLGVSCHCNDDVLESIKLGCTYASVGHIFRTDCKKGIEGKGISFLENICKNSSIPIYAIGGINKNNISSIKNTGAFGICTMSGAMLCDDTNSYFKNLKL